MSGSLPAAGDVPVPEAAPDDVRRLADEVLADPVFDRPDPGLLVRARDWVFEQVGAVLERLLSSAGDGPLGWVIAIVLALAATALVVRLTRGVRRDHAAPAGPHPGPRRPATDWLADAARFEAAGDWRAGLRCRYRALVAALASRGLVAEVPGRTAGEYRSALARSAPVAAPAFDGATTLFEVAWYGGGEVGADDTRRFGELSDRVLADAGGRR